MNSKWTAAERWYTNWKVGRRHFVHYFMTVTVHMTNVAYVQTTINIYICLFCEIATGNDTQFILILWHNTR